ncbi:MAG TPA: major capsid protein [Limnochordia bacterium]|nr:major capsid protein [Limnochordia bacterium]
MPTASSGHIDTYLTNYSRKLSNGMFIADNCFTVVPAAKDSGKIATYGTDNLRAPSNALRAPGAAPNSVDYSRDSINFVLNEYTLRESVTDEDIAQADSPFTPLEDAAANAREKVMIVKEKAAAAFLFSTTQWSKNTTLSGTDQWSDYANSDPFDDVKTAILSVAQNSLRRPNKIVMGIQVMETIKNHPDLIDRVKYTGSQSITAQALARLWEVDQVLVGEAVENTAKEGAADSLGFIWGKGVWIGYVEQRPSLRAVTACSLVRSRSFPVVERYRDADQGTKKQWVAYGDKWDMIEVLDGAGYYIASAVA